MHEFCWHYYESGGWFKNNLFDFSADLRAENWTFVLEDWDFTAETVFGRETDLLTNRAVVLMSCGRFIFTLHRIINDYIFSVFFLSVMNNTFHFLFSLVFRSMYV